MKSEITTTPLNLVLGDLCVLVDLPVRTVRYYIQIGLVDKPDGETRAARYGTKHLDQLILIKKWTSSGVSLERIGQMLKGINDPPVPERSPATGAIRVCSCATVAPGIEISIEPALARLSPEQVRSFVRSVQDLFEHLNSSKNTDER